jgi:hypothetical protein
MASPEQDRGRTRPAAKRKTAVGATTTPAAATWFRANIPSPNFAAFGIGLTCQACYTSVNKALTTFA